MEFLEKDLEQIIWESNDEQLENAGIYGFTGRRFRQLKIGNYGIADLVTVEKITVYDHRFFNVKKLVFIDSYLLITVYELKKEKIGISALLQAVNYATGIKSYLIGRGFDKFILKIVLIGKKIDESGSFCFMSNLIDCELPELEAIRSKGFVNSIDFYTYNMKIDGLKFYYEKYSELNNEGF